MTDTMKNYKFKMKIKIVYLDLTLEILHFLVLL
jgi:hypothetical protein